jgi:DNA modification methylase
MSTDPTYRTRCVDIYVGKAEDVLPTLVTESLDLVVTDPPYGVDFQSNFGQNHDAIANDGVGDRDLIASVIRECVRLVGQKRHLYVFGPDDVMAAQKVSSTATIIWDKENIGMGDLSLPWGSGFEPIQFAVSLHRHGGKAGSEALAAKMRRSTVVLCPRTTGRHNLRHPTEKPVELLRQLIESSSVPGETVLDPFAGVGSTGVAAVIEGRNAVLVEMRADYAQVAHERILAAEAAVEALVGL